MALASLSLGCCNPPDFVSRPCSLYKPLVRPGGLISVWSFKVLICTHPEIPISPVSVSQSLSVCIRCWLWWKRFTFLKVLSLVLSLVYLLAPGNIFCLFKIAKEASVSHSLLRVSNQLPWACHFLSSVPQMMVSDGCRHHHPLITVCSVPLMCRRYCQISIPFWLTTGEGLSNYTASSGQGFSILPLRGEEAEVRCFWRLGPSKVAMYTREFRNTCVYTVKMHAQINSEKRHSLRAYP